MRTVCGWLIPALFLFMGCGKSEPELVAVSGRVLLRSRPLPGGTIVFTPDRDRGGRGSQAWAEIGPDGAFVLATDGKAGVLPGWHKITVAPHRSCPMESRPSARYLDPDLSELEFEVRPGRNNRCELRLE